jgi:hypothetical protein
VQENAGCQFAWVCDTSARNGTGEAAIGVSDRASDSVDEASLKANSILVD